MTEWWDESWEPRQAAHLMIRCGIRLRMNLVR